MSSTSVSGLQRYSRAFCSWWTATQSKNAAAEGQREQQERRAGHPDHAHSDGRRRSQGVVPRRPLLDQRPPAHDLGGLVHAEDAHHPALAAVERHEAPLLDRARTRPPRGRPARPARRAGSCGRTDRTRTTGSGRRAGPPSPASSDRAAWVPIAMALSQCSTRITSSKRWFGQRATSPAATTPGAAVQVASHTTPLSMREARALEPVGVRA